MHSGDVLQSLLERRLIALKNNKGEGVYTGSFQQPTRTQTYGNIHKLVLYVSEWAFAFCAELQRALESLQLYTVGCF
jgi:hypothetical protein